MRWRWRSVRSPSCGSAGFCCFTDRTAFRAALFPLLFLAFMVPIPSMLLDGLIFLLRSGSADAVAGLFSLTGTLYYREGFVFTLPSVVIEVAEECSGIRSSIALVLTALLAGHMWLDSGWKKAVLVAVAHSADHPEERHPDRDALAARRFTWIPSF